MSCPLCGQDHRRRLDKGKLASAFIIVASVAYLGGHVIVAIVRGNL